MKLLLVEDEIHLAEALKNDFAQKRRDKKLSLLLYILNSPYIMSLVNSRL